VPESTAQFSDYFSKVLASTQELPKREDPIEQERSVAHLAEAQAPTPEDQATAFFKTLLASGK
jgi:hypothetical protein